MRWRATLAYARSRCVAVPAAALSTVSLIWKCVCVVLAAHGAGYWAAVAGENAPCNQVIAALL